MTCPHRDCQPTPINSPKPPRPICKARHGAALVVAGPRQPADVQALCHWINNALRAPVDFIAPIDPVVAGNTESLRALADDIHAGHTRNAHHHWRQSGLRRAGRSCGWPTPFPQYRSRRISVFIATRPQPAAPGTCRCLIRSKAGPTSAPSTARASIVQPLIRPLYDTRTAHQLLAILSGAIAASSFDLVRNQWRASHNTGDFVGWWRQSLQDGVIADTAAPKITPPSPKLAANRACKRRRHVHSDASARSGSV